MGWWLKWAVMDRRRNRNKPRLFSGRSRSPSTSARASADRPGHACLVRYGGRPRMAELLLVGVVRRLHAVDEHETETVRRPVVLLQLVRVFRPVSHNRETSKQILRPPCLQTADERVPRRYLAGAALGDAGRVRVEHRGRLLRPSAFLRFSRI